ncbi:hypothetical protein Tco_0760446 [Tanacetum coccineum]
MGGHSSPIPQIFLLKPLQPPVLTQPSRQNQTTCPHGFWPKPLTLVHSTAIPYPSPLPITPITFPVQQYTKTRAPSMVRLCTRPNGGLGLSVRLPTLTGITSQDKEKEEGLYKREENKSKKKISRDIAMGCLTVGTVDPGLVLVSESVVLDWVEVVVLRTGVQGSSNTAKAELVAKTRRTSFCSPAPAPAPVKAVELSCVTCGWCPFSPITVSHYGNVYRDNNFRGPGTLPVKPIPEVQRTKVHPSCSQSTAPVQSSVGPEHQSQLSFEPIDVPVLGKSLHFLIFSQLAWTLELAGSINSNTMGMQKDISVKVGCISLARDFVVVDFEPETPSPFNSRRLLLKKPGLCLIDVKRVN